MSIAEETHPALSEPAARSADWIGPGANGVAMTPEEFDAIDDWDPASRYERNRETVVVSPIPAEGEARPNDELGFLFCKYRDDHPQGVHRSHHPGTIYLPPGRVTTSGGSCRVDRLGTHAAAKD